MSEGSVTCDAGWRLLEAQHAAGTQFCLGIDPHVEMGGDLNEEFFSFWASAENSPNPDRLDRMWGLYSLIFEAVSTAEGMFDTDVLEERRLQPNSIRFMVGVTEYLLQAIEVAWDCCVRVFKPQIAFFEQFGEFGPIMLQIVRNHIRHLSQESDEQAFVILDAKRGDISSTQAAYMRTYLARRDEVVIPGMPGRYDFDAITVNTYMGTTDVLTTALPWLRRGKAVIVVNNTSNPNSDEFQGIRVQPDGMTTETINHLSGDHQFDACVSEIMLLETERFCQTHGLIHDGISPVLSVMGATQEFDDTFCRLRPSGTALIPGFGAQGGGFGGVMALAPKRDPRQGVVGICSSSRKNLFPTLKRYGGSGDPRQLRADMKRGIDEFRAMELAAYDRAGIEFPFK